jgi:predicted RNase H-like nuclease (RuvC/YqgF family)
MRLLRSRKTHNTALFLAGLVFVAAGWLYGQSLGEVARQQRQQQSKTAKTPRKVITNEDIPERPKSASESTADDSVSDEHGEDSGQPRRGGSAKTAEQWKAEIQAQKSDIAALQAQLDRLKASIHYVQANLYVNGAEYNQLQLKKQQQAERLQKQLDDMKQKLESTQEAARKAGFGNAVYDP